MGAVRQLDEERSKRRPAAKTPEAREQQMEVLAYDLAEKQMREGTASAQVITHFLKAASSRERLEQERLALENQLTGAKIEALQAQERVEELYKEALGAMRAYQGVENPMGDDDESSDEFDVY